MYNLTPHGTTGKSTSELLYARTIRDKIPSSVTDIINDRRGEEAYERDLLNKQKGTREEGIHIEDKVLIRNTIIPRKLPPNFGKATKQHTRLYSETEMNYYSNDKSL